VRQRSAMTREAADLIQEVAFRKLVRLVRRQAAAAGMLTHADVYADVCAASLCQEVAFRKLVRLVRQQAAAAAGMLTYAVAC
jgi:hypothetical protein